MVPKRTYALKDDVPDEVQSALKKYHPLLQKLLYHRGMIDTDSAELFLNPDYDNHLHDPFLLTDMERAVERILAALEEKEHIVIYSDYDCDGIPGGVVLHDLFTSLGIEHFANYIPHRHHEGYGFTPEAVDVLQQKEKPALIITVDCGIVDHAAVDAANSAGMDVIITDHHEPADTLPNAYAILNPKRDNSYPFTGLCGAGVAFKLAQALLTRGRERGSVTLKDGMEKWWLDMVGLATIADMVPLVDENRALAYYGLQVLRKSRRPGLQQLLRRAGGDQRYLTEDDIGFTIAPRINAASRMDTPEEAFHMLRTKNEGEAGAHAATLERLNNERKGVVAAMVREVKKKMSLLDELPDVIVLGDPTWRPSLVGLVANSLAETYKRPVFLWGRDGRGVLKGSCRSEGETSTLSLMQATPDSFIDFGGHHASGGFSVDDAKIHTLADNLNQAFKATKETELKSEHKIELDADIRLDDIDEAFMRALKALAPYGEANPKPLFRLKEVTPISVEVFGKAKDHTKLIFDTKKGKREAIAFFKTPVQFAHEPKEGAPITLIAHVEESYFMRRPQVRLRIVDIV
jgi:single-stranded-DNA-specific exonuclease